MLFGGAAFSRALATLLCHVLLTGVGTVFHGLLLLQQLLLLLLLQLQLLLLQLLLLKLFYPANLQLLLLFSLKLLLLFLSVLDLLEALLTPEFLLLFFR